MTAFLLQAAGAGHRRENRENRRRRAGTGCGVRPSLRCTVLGLKEVLAQRAQWQRMNFRCHCRFCRRVPDGRPPAEPE